MANRGRDGTVASAADAASGMNLRQRDRTGFAPASVRADGSVAPKVRHFLQRPTGWRRHFVEDEGAVGTMSVPPSSKTQWMWTFKSIAPLSTLPARENQSVDESEFRYILPKAQKFPREFMSNTWSSVDVVVKGVVLKFARGVFCALLPAAMMVGCGGGGSAGTSPTPPTQPAAEVLPGVDSSTVLSNPGSPTYTMGSPIEDAATQLSTLGRSVALSAKVQGTAAIRLSDTVPLALTTTRQSTISPSVPWAKQRADGCGDSGHCSHTTLIMAAAYLNRTKLQAFVPECQSSSTGNVSDACVKAVQSKFEADRNYTGALTTSNCGSVEKSGPRNRLACGCTVPPDDLVQLGKSNFGLNFSQVIRIDDNPGNSTEPQYVKNQLSAIVSSGCVASIRVPYPVKADRAARKLPTTGGGHYILLVGQEADSSGSVTNYIFNDPFNTDDESDRKNAVYTADSVAGALIANKSIYPAHIAAYCPTTGPLLAIENQIPPVLEVNKAFPGFRINTKPEGATFSADGALPPGLSITPDGLISGIPSQVSRDGAPFEFGVVAEFRFGPQSRPLVSQAKRQYSIVVKGSEPLRLSAPADLGSIPSGESYTTRLSNWANKLVSWGIEGGGDAVRVVGDFLYISPSSSNPTSFLLTARSGIESLTSSIRFSLTTKQSTPEPAPEIVSIDPPLPIASRTAQVFSIIGNNSKDDTRAELVSA